MDKIIIIGAGPAGLAAGYCLAKNNIKATILEKETIVGGMCKTIDYKGYKFDIGGHRFFTDLTEIERLWHSVPGVQLLKRPRLSRIYYNNKFFDYPLRLPNTLKNIGPLGSILIFLSFLKSQIHKKREIISFQDYITRHFGKRLFKIFFKSYTEKVWGMPCSLISADWARERIAGLSMVSAVSDALIFGRDNSIRTLTKEFYYPPRGPGSMYEAIAKEATSNGSDLKTGFEVIEIICDSQNITAVLTKDKNNKKIEFKADSFISSMPLTELIQKIRPLPSEDVLRASRMLKYRDFLTVNLICSEKNIFPDNWLYIHSPKVLLGRIQNYKNWSLRMVPDSSKTTLGLEYFCSRSDKLWNMDDKAIINIAIKELMTIGLKVTAEDAFVVKALNAYPMYALDYKKHLKIITDYIARFKNLQTIGRAGRFKYDNMDLAMESGIFAANKIRSSFCEANKY